MDSLFLALSYLILGIIYAIIGGALLFAAYSLFFTGRDILRARRVNMTLPEYYATFERNKL